MTDDANRRLDGIFLPVNNELGDSIIKAWLKMHLTWAQDTYDHAKHADDRTDAEQDMKAFRRVLEYIGGDYD